MLKATRELQQYLTTATGETDSALVKALLIPIEKWGSTEDAKVLLEVWAANPEGLAQSQLLPVLGALGDNGVAKRLAAVSLSSGQLKDAMPPEVLEVLGKLRYPPVKALLAQHAFSQEADYYLQRSAVIGLLHFDCPEYQSEIESALANCLNKNLFPEFIPALVSKLSQREMWLKKLYELGDEHASTDCNAGIVLGFSLCGAEGRPYFERALFNPNWEIYLSATGTSGFAYEGLNNLGITFTSLFNRIRNLTEPRELEYSLWVLFRLLEHRLEDYGAGRAESIRSIYSGLFSGLNAITLDDIAAQVNCEEEAGQLKKRLDMRLTTELLMENMPEAEQRD